MGFAHMILNRMLPMLPNLVILFFCAFSFCPQCYLGNIFSRKIQVPLRVKNRGGLLRRLMTKLLSTEAYSPHEGDINSYSARLHDLQDRFDGTRYVIIEDFRKAFQHEYSTSEPKVKRWFDQDDANETLFTRNRPGPVVSQPRSPSHNQLAFESNLLGSSKAQKENVPL